MEHLRPGDRVRVIGPRDSSWLEDEGTAVQIEQEAGEWLVVVEIEDDGQHVFKPEHLEKVG